MGNCLRRGFFRAPDAAAGALLDKIVSQAEEDAEDVTLYKLADYRKGGSLVDAYRRGGSKEVERMAREELADYMYDSGEGTALQEDAYSQLNNHNNNEVAVTIVPNADVIGDGKADPRRRVCWKLEYRGLLGESILHVLLLCNTPIHGRIARVLMKVYPHLAYDIIEGSEYFGASALHLAIAYQNSEIVSKLVEGGAAINQRATGRFFLPFDQQREIPRKTSDFEGLCYLGEYPLAWAACVEDETSYNLLLNKGADPNLADTFGNMILHMVVIQDKLKMFGYALRHPKNPAKDGVLNKFGLTPLTLACKLGRNKIFREMLELSALEFWRYSNITCSGYPLNALDSILPSGRTNWNSALMIILNGKTNEHLDMLDGGVIQRLLEEKWKTFARRQFLKRLALMLLHLMTLSIAVFLRPKVEENLFGGTDTTTITFGFWLSRSVLVSSEAARAFSRQKFRTFMRIVWEIENKLSNLCRYCAELGTCLGCIGFVVFQQGEEIMAQGLFGFLINLSSNPAKAIFLVSNILVMMCIPCRIFNDRLMEDWLLALALPGSWFFLIFFAGAVRLTGPFITMIYNMLVGDMFRFSIIYLIFLLAFTQAFFFLFKSNRIEEDESSETFDKYYTTWMALFHMTLGTYQYKNLNLTYYARLTQVVFALFMVVTPILLFNMLIAMMGNTYCEVIAQSEREWMRQWAKIVVALERAISQKMASDFMNIYSIKLPSPDADDDPEKELRAVMVIKSKNKTKARQRKGALMNWKRYGKKIITELRQCGGTAEAFRLKLHNAQKALVAKELQKRRSEGDFHEVDHDSPTAGDGFSKALNQLAFSGDWDGGLTAATEQPDVTSPKASFGDLFQQVAWAHDIDIDQLTQNASTIPTDAQQPSPTIPNEVSDQDKEDVQITNKVLVSQDFIQVSQTEVPVPTADDRPATFVETLLTQADVLPHQSETLLPVANETGETTVPRAGALLNGNVLPEICEPKKKTHKSKKKCKKLRKSKVDVEDVGELPTVRPKTAKNVERTEELPAIRPKTAKHASKRKKHAEVSSEATTSLHQIDECSELGEDNSGFMETSLQGEDGRSFRTRLEGVSEPPEDWTRPTNKFGSRRVQAMTSLVAWEEPGGDV